MRLVLFLWRDTYPRSQIYSIYYSRFISSPIITTDWVESLSRILNKHAASREDYGEISYIGDEQRYRITQSMGLIANDAVTLFMRCHGRNKSSDDSEANTFSVNITVTRNA